MVLKKWHKYISYKVNKDNKKTYGDCVIPVDDIEVPNEVLKNTGYEERAWNERNENK